MIWKCSGHSDRIPKYFRKNIRQNSKIKMVFVLSRLLEQLDE
ncbi:hypothetical protein LBBP_03113 [Leptospira borgpetersenii serovar Ballum]|uniref:Uncharacterized protein n=1 Tax=Leptospira borgpetersenii serovar Ballum TaxID=280505 RepID=A0A0S2IUI7_LEPBO|nr:hypothetical protein LBBP_03113 [Leptospira borgpetersenii serovar Ballum]